MNIVLDTTIMIALTRNPKQTGIVVFKPVAEVVMFQKPFTGSIHVWWYRVFIASVTRCIERL
jgi:hypothetical protein